MTLKPETAVRSLLSIRQAQMLLSGSSISTKTMYGLSTTALQPMVLSAGTV